jgi:hypothetical protein
LDHIFGKTYGSLAGVDILLQLVEFVYNDKGVALG